MSVMKVLECDGVTWQPVKVLGKGSFGEAVLLQDTADRTRQAVCKRINLSALKAEEQKDAHNEVKVLSKLRHPNIVEFIGSCQVDTYLCILMEYCNAGDIESLIKKQKGVFLEENMVADLFVQLCHAVRYLHERRILHRDLKAQNVFLTQSMSSSGSTAPRLIVKLGDFGISTVLRNTLALAKTICGTPYYFSPELCLNRPYNNKSDVWSLGCILYEMCTLKHAFDAQNMKALMQRILTGKYTPVPSQYHPSLQTLVDGMLVQKVDKRFNIQQVMDTVFFQQHSERIIVAHETRKEFHQQQQSKKASSSQGQGPGNIIMTSGVPLGPKPSQNDLKAKQVEARRKEIEMRELEKKIQIEEQRRRKNIQHAQNYGKKQEERIVARHEELERLDDIRRRMEIMSYEDQQKYVEKGWRVVQDVQIAQEERKKQLTDNDRHLQSLLEQMNAMDAKMQSRREKRQAPPPLEVVRPPPPASLAREPSARELAQAYKNRVSEEAPWNRNRDVPVGFTRETWEAHKQVMNRNEAPVTPQRGFQRGGAPAGGVSPTSGGVPPLDVLAMPLGHLSDNDVSMMLRQERQKMEKDPKMVRQLEDEEEARRRVAAQAEWERHRAMIREADARAPAVPKPLPPPQLQQQQLSAAEQLWQDQQAKILAARGGALPPPPRSPPIRPSTSNTEAPVGAFASPQRPLADVPQRSPQRGSHPSLPSPARCTVSPPSRSSTWEGGGDGDGDDGGYYSDDFEPDDGFDNVVQAMRHGEQQQPPPDLFEEAPLPVDDVARIGNTMKFTLDGKTLHLPNATADDPLSVRCDALRQFLSDALGGQRSFTKLYDSLLNIQSAEVDDSLADAMLCKLEQQYGKKSCFVDLMVQLMVCEAMLK